MDDALIRFWQPAELRQQAVEVLAAASWRGGVWAIAELSARTIGIFSRELPAGRRTIVMVFRSCAAPQTDQSAPYWRVAA